MTAVARAPVGTVAERQQGCDVAIGDEPHVATLGAVAAVGPAAGHVSLTPERDRARTTVSPTRVQLRLVDEPGHASEDTGGP